MKDTKIIGKCISCGKDIYSDCDTNYNRTLFICKYCNYPNKIENQKS